MKTLDQAKKDILENEFNFYEDDNYIELESWTNGGVDMLIYIDKESDKTVVEQLEDFVETFDIDETIDLHRQGQDYKEAFTIRESINDFEAYIEDIKFVIKKLRESEEC